MNSALSCASWYYKRNGEVTHRTISLGRMVAQIQRSEFWDRLSLPIVFPAALCNYPMNKVPRMSTPLSSLKSTPKREVISSADVHVGTF